MIKCRVCSAENEAEAAFCGVCGSALAPQEAETAEVEPKASAKPEPEPRPEPASDPKPAPEPILTTGMKPIPTPKPAPEQAGVTCPACGTLNDISRDFCRKCATALRALPPVKRAPRNRRLILQFVVSAVVGTAVVISGAWVVTRLADAPAAQAAVPISVTDQTGVQVEFGVQPATPTPLGPLPVTSTIQLASYEEPAASTAPGGLGGTGRGRWWNDSTPRIPTVTQFDGGPLQGVNCVMASGAMLARLAFGIVTTGSQLRALSGDREGATGFAELQRAVYSGWGVRFSMGSASPLQLRALLYAGAGAMVVLAYGEVPVGIRLSKGFTGNHAVYVDAFRPEGAEGPAAYWVMDPIGHSWPNYKGAWWPAEVIERAATAFGRGKVAMAWAFAGGVVPINHPVLPQRAYPPGTPGETPGPDSTPGPSGSGGPLVDHVPFGDLPLEIDPTVGTEPPDGPRFPRTDFVTDLFTMQTGASFLKCASLPAPRGCPAGIVGIIDLLGLTQATPPPLPGIKLLYADAIAPGTYRIIFEAPPDSDRSLLLWNSGGGGTLEEAKVESGLLGGTAVSIATITLDPTISYSFVATATGDSGSSISSVGSLLITR